MAGEPSWFEVGVGDVDRARTFYGELLSWEFEDVGPGGAVLRTPGLSGGIHPGDKGARPYLFFAVTDLDAAIARVRELGGEVEPMEGVDPETESRYGRFVLCTDDQGSGFGLHQPAG